MESFTQSLNVNYNQVKNDLLRFKVKMDCIHLLEDNSLDLESWKILYNLIKDQIKLRSNNEE
jgi:hypothetical protein